MSVGDGEVYCASSRNACPECHWISAVVLLSLELTLYFAVELGISKFYSKELRQIAVSIIEGLQATDTLEMYSGIAGLVPDAFLRRVISSCGENTARELTDWVRQALPPDAEVKNAWRLGDAFHSLSLQWKTLPSNVDVPFGRPEDSHIRLMITSHLQWQYSVIREVGLVETMIASEWDNYLANMDPDMPEYISTLVSGTINVRESRAFLDAILGQTTEEQTEMLLSVVSGWR